LGWLPAVRFIPQERVSGGLPPTVELRRIMGTLSVRIMGTVPIIRTMASALQSRIVGYCQLPSSRQSVSVSVIGVFGDNHLIFGLQECNEIDELLDRHTIVVNKHQRLAILRDRFLGVAPDQFVRRIDD